ncbi:MAG: hypothetical protein HYR84_11055 [Planctomycetes bacterium]|nr:hypothetical protein [Planctomycetota bacterium]
MEVQERPQTLGQIGRAIITPLRSAAGQLMPPRAEPAPTQDDVARMAADGRYSPVEIFAAHVKADEMQARSRQAAVKYLASVDCSYFPEAESGLIASLRSDRIESVRYEAALALGNAPRLTEKMLEALNMTALGICLDGHPIEVSERVRQAAKQSLERCAARGLCLAPAQHTVLPSVDMLPPRPVVIQPIYYQAPMAVPTALPVSAQERHLAETISTSAKTPAAAAPSRPLLQFLMRFTSPREPADASQKHVDPRLRGLAPLGNDGSLVIPNSAK